ncbi:hypothetical protein F2P56_005866, partial [Juglans regia]
FCIYIIRIFLFRLKLSKRVFTLSQFLSANKTHSFQRITDPSSKGVAGVFKPVLDVKGNKYVGGFHNQMSSAASWLCLSRTRVLQNRGEEQGRDRRTPILVSILDHCGYTYSS